MQFIKKNNAVSIFWGIAISMIAMNVVMYIFYEFTNKLVFYLIHIIFKKLWGVFTFGSLILTFITVIRCFIDKQSLDKKKIKKVFDIIFVIFLFIYLIFIRAWKANK